jgi:hypothetical protein
MTLQDDRPDAVTVARDVRALISDPDRWTTCAYARTAIGTKCAPLDPQAVQWCALGAVVRIADDARLERMIAGALCTAAADLGIGYGSPASINDQRGHDAVLKMYDRAIELLEQEAAVA